jgi:hypothetical protein
VPANVNNVISADSTCLSSNVLLDDVDFDFDHAEQPGCLGSTSFSCQTVLSSTMDKVKVLFLEVPVGHRRFKQFTVESLAEVPFYFRRPGDCVVQARLPTS